MKEVNNNTRLVEDLVSDFCDKNEILDIPSGWERFVITTRFKSMNQDEISDSITDGGNDGGIDSIIIKYNGAYIPTESEFEQCFNESIAAILEITFIQAKYTTSFTESPLHTFHTNLTDILDWDLDDRKINQLYNIEVVNKIKLINFVWKKISKTKKQKISFNYFFVTKANTNKVSSRILDLTKKIKLKFKELVNSSNASVELLSANEIYSMYKQREDSTIQIKFLEAINPEYTNNIGVAGLGYIGIVRISDLYTQLLVSDNELNEEIFDYNVRDYLGENDVNKDIQATLIDNDSGEFWWFNNGITILANEATLNAKTLTMFNPQVVNGLQTSNVIYKYFSSNEEKINDERSILVRVIIPKIEKNKTKNEELENKIIYSTNNQSKVTLSDLSSTGEIQRKIEDYFRQKGYYYERRKNFYKNQNFPALKIFTLQKTAVCVHSILNRDPAYSRQFPTTLASIKKKYNLIFKENRDFSAYLSSCLIVQLVEKNKLKFGTFKFNNQDNKYTTFVLHLSRILVSLILKKVNYNDSEIININLSEIKLDDYITSIKQILDKSLNVLALAKPNTTLVNWAKSTDLNNSIDKQIEDFINSETCMPLL